jgi:hypothetical protein
MKITALFFLFLMACTSQHRPVETVKFEVTEIAQEVQIPKMVMNEVDEEVKKDGAAVAPVYLFTPLQVQFTELSANVLKNPSFSYVFPKGGGQLDLKDVVTGEGSFYMSFPPEQFEKMPEIMHLYYVSNSPKKKIGDESFGLGCGKMLDLKKSFSKLQKLDFLKLNTNEQRYVYVTAGRFIFVFKQATQVYISQLTITDSRFSKELCLGADFL